MIAMLKTDLIWMRAMVPQTLAILAFFIIICLGFADTSALTMFVPLVCISVPFSFMTNLFAIDELNGWQVFRLALPLSRTQVIGGRALTGLVAVLGALGVAAVLAALWFALAPDTVGDLPRAAILMGGAGSAAALLMIGVLMPCVARFGFTKAVRYLPVVLMSALILGMLAVGQWGGLAAGAAWSDALGASPLGAVVQSLDGWLTTSPTATLVACAGVAVGAAALVYALLCLLAVQFYRRRQF